MSGRAFIARLYFGQARVRDPIPETDALSCACHGHPASPTTRSRPDRAGPAGCQHSEPRYEQALDILEALPVNPSTLEQSFEIRLELRTVLTQLAELRVALERLREAETLSERLNDEHRRVRVCSVLTTLHTLLGNMDGAVATGPRALEVAGRLGDLRLRILTTSYLEQAQYYRGESSWRPKAARQTVTSCRSRPMS